MREKQMRHKRKGDCNKAHTVFCLKNKQTNKQKRNYHTRQENERIKIQDFQVEFF